MTGEQRLYWLIALVAFVHKWGRTLAVALIVLLIWVCMHLKWVW